MHIYCGGCMKTYCSAVPEGASVREHCGPSTNAGSSSHVAPQTFAPEHFSEFQSFIFLFHFFSPGLIFLLSSLLPSFISVYFLADLTLFFFSSSFTPAELGHSYPSHVPVAYHLLVFISLVICRFRNSRGRLVRDRGFGRWDKSVK